MTEIRDYNNKLIQININTKNDLIILRIGKEIVMLDYTNYQELLCSINKETNNIMVKEMEQ
jgi:hypothetical protein